MCPRAIGHRRGSDPASDRELGIRGAHTALERRDCPRTRQGRSSRSEARAAPKRSRFEAATWRHLGVDASARRPFPCRRDAVPAQRATRQIQMPDELATIEQPPRPAPSRLIRLGRPPGEFSVAGLGQVERLGTAVGMRVPGSVDARPCINRSHVAEIAVDVGAHERSDVHRNSVSHPTDRRSPRRTALRTTATSRPR
jgi:hypothetical protein